MIKQIPVSRIYVPNQRFPENLKHDPDYQVLLDAVQKEGLLSAILVMSFGPNEYWLLDGRLRLAVAIELGHKTIRCVEHENH